MNASILYPLKPIGLDTVLCESFTSYITRLAYAHCITPGDLINNVVAVHLDKNYIKRSASYGGNRFYDGAKSLNGISGTSSEIVDILQKLTTQDSLNSLTLNKWRNVIPPRELLKKKLSWCPLCIRKFQEENSVYYPLIWCLKLVNICLEHDIPLHNKCPECDQELPILHRKMVNGQCTYCSGSLTVVSTEVKTERDYFYAKEAEVFVKSNPHVISSVEKGFVNERLNMLITRATNGNLASFRKVIGAPNVTFYGWLRGENLPKIDSIINICYCMGITVLDLLNTSYLPQLKIRGLPFPNLLIPSGTKKKHDYKLIEMELKSYLDLLVPKSMVEVAKDMNINKRLIYENLPEMAKQVSARHSQYIKQRKKEKEKEITTTIKKAVEELRHRNIKPTQRNVEDFLGNKGLLRGKFAKEAREKSL